METSHGKIRGHVLKSGDGKNFYAFQEIPYAAPPIGNKRFTVMYWLQWWINNY